MGDAAYDNSGTGRMFTIRPSPIFNETKRPVGGQSILLSPPGS